MCYISRGLSRDCLPWGTLLDLPVAESTHYSKMHTQKYGFQSEAMKMCKYIDYSLENLKIKNNPFTAFYNIIDIYYDAMCMPIIS